MSLMIVNVSLFICLNINELSFYNEQLVYLVSSVNIVWVITYLAFQGYKIHRTSRVFEVIKSQWKITLFHFFVYSSFTLLGPLDIGNEIIVSFYLILAIITGAWHFLFTLLIRSYRTYGLNFRKVIIIGDEKNGRKLRHFFQSSPGYGFRFVKLFGTGSESTQELKEVEQYVIQQHIDEIYCCLPQVSSEDLKRLVDFGEINFVKVRVLGDYSLEVSSDQSRLSWYGDIPVLKLTSTPLDEWHNRLIKRTFDLIFSSVIIVFLLSWVYPLIYILIKLDSKGKVLFRQKRNGKNNKEFYCYKFRTMKVNNDSEISQTAPDDSRITKIGCFLRQTSLDELPQFINVFKGNMSIVGPRPHPVTLNSYYSPKIEKFMLRHVVKPGITGLAQIKGFRGPMETTELMRSRVILDKFYLKNWSVFFDCKIVLKTIFLTKKDLLEHIFSATQLVSKSNSLQVYEQAE
ncbi:MAG: exopolysaccharide biosynthesis polyprenyl glycosylphosphotransferase [Bacteroidota bacterium]